jgi:hypothetical protein
MAIGQIVEMQRVEATQVVTGRFNEINGASLQSLKDRGGLAIRQAGRPGKGVGSNCDHGRAN